MPRAPIEILRDLQSLMAELTAAMQEDGPRTTTDNISGVGTNDLSPKLNRALSSMAERDRERPVSRETRDPPIESHEDIRAKARAYKPEQPKDSYRQSYDPGFDEAVFMGTGDQREE
jgi:hypothetical protein